MSKVTMCLAAHNAISAVQLMWESFLKFHGPGAVDLFAHDNLSTDGVNEYLRQNTAKITDGEDLFHGRALNQICSYVTTPYTLIADTDLEFHAPVVGRLINELEHKPDIGCVCYPSGVGKADLGACTIDGLHFVSKLRIDPCLAIFRTPELRRWTAATVNGVGWDSDRDVTNGHYYDAGGRLRQAMEADGYRLVEPDWLWRSVTHFGGVATMFYIDGWGPEAAAKHEHDQFHRRARYAAIQERLRILRRL